MPTEDGSESVSGIFLIINENFFSKGAGVVPKLPHHYPLDVTSFTENHV